jgi:Bcr/CflA subfamily drug resistance transporter
MPTMVDYFGTSNSMIQLTLTSWGFGLGMFQLFMGPWSDHHGRRPALIIGGIIFLVGTLGCALAMNPEILLIGRFVQGVGTCSMFMLTITAMKEVFDAEERVKWLVSYNMVRSLAPLIGPVLGSYLLLWLNWQASFYFIFALGLFALIGMLLSLPETCHKADNGTFTWAAVMRSYGLAIKDWTLMRHVLTNSAIFGGMMVYLTCGAFILIERLGMSAQGFAYTQVVISFFYIAGAACVKRGYAKWGAHKVILLGTGIAFAGTVAMIATNWLETIPTVLGAMAIYSFGFGMSSTPTFERALSHDVFKAGLVGALLGFSITVASSLGSFISSLVPISSLSCGLVMAGFAFVGCWIYRHEGV